MRKNQTSILILQLHQLLLLMPPEELIAKLQEIKEPEHKKTLDFIIKKTAEHYRIAVEDIRFSTKRGVVSDAKKITILLLKKHLPISYGQIAFFFGGKARQGIYRAIKYMENLNPNSKNKQEKELFERYQQINNEVLKYNSKAKKLI